MRGGSPFEVRCQNILNNRACYASVCGCTGASDIVARRGQCPSRVHMLVPSKRFSSAAAWYL